MTTAQAASRALTAIREPETKGAPHSMTSNRLADWFGLKTFGEPCLMDAVAKGGQFCNAIKRRERPHWFTLCGGSGVGKTHIAKKIYKWACNTDYLAHEVVDGEIRYATEFCYWPELASRLQQGEARDYVLMMARVKLLVLDDVGAIQDKTGHVTSQLGILLGMRSEKWTVITTNLSLREVSERLDTRISSRILRDGGKLVDIDTTDYSLRKNK